jgi:hypothetical protein
MLNSNVEWETASPHRGPICISLRLYLRANDEIVSCYRPRELSLHNYNALSHFMLSYLMFNVKWTIEKVITLTLLWLHGAIRPEIILVSLNPSACRNSALQYLTTPPSSFSVGIHNHQILWTTNSLNSVACRAFAMQRPRNGRIYQGGFWTTAR